VPDREPTADFRNGIWVTIRLVSSLDILVSRLPDGAVSTDAQTRRERAIDSWALALLRRVRGDELAEPAAVVFPAGTEEVATVLAWASETGTAVIPRGLGSGVCGGAEADQGAVVLDLSRMDRIGDIDLVSLTVDVQAGVRGDRLEEALAGPGLTVGHYPQSIALSTVGGWIAASSAGQASTGFGAVEDVLLGLTAVLPQGEILRCRPVPRSAAGPDLRRLLVGSEGTLAVVTEATLACRKRPAAWEWLAFAFPDFGTLADALRQVRQAETGAAVLRGYDETDAGLGFGALGHQGGCVALAGFPAALAGFPAALPGLTAREQAAAEILRQAGTDLGARYGEHWWRHRNDAVQTYAQIMGPERAFGPGVIVDTIEVAGLWSAVPRLYDDITGALSAHAQAVGCHLSHLYPSGSSLYFTFLIGGADDQDAEDKYRTAWVHAARRCTDAGGTITHHHGVGRLKAPFLAAELGETGAGVLAGIRAALDPAGIMNPRSARP
jgi:alkyldihydroxyacetonephosphate synthase